MPITRGSSAYVAEDTTRASGSAPTSAAAAALASTTALAPSLRGVALPAVISGILLVVLAFWTSGEFFLERAATLVVFAGIWAAVKGVNDIVRAFEIRSLAG